MKELIITKNDENQRLDRFVGKAVPLLPESLLQKYIRLKRIKVNGKGAKRDTRLTEGDVLSLYINDEFFDKPREENSYLKIATPKLNIVYEDENIILVDKKPGVLCHSAGKWDNNTLVAHIQAYCYQKGEWRPREEHSFAPALCNRIDRNTGGIVIAAKNAEALRIINDHIKRHDLKKSYVCIVTGKVPVRQGTLKGFIFKDAVKNRVYVRDQVVAGAKTAVTHFSVIARSGTLTLLECELETGRTHQIRAQCAHAGFPLLGDSKYGDDRVNKTYGETGQLLYSYKLEFDFGNGGGILSYLNGRIFRITDVEFVKKYFHESLL